MSRSLGRCAEQTVGKDVVASDVRTPNNIGFVVKMHEWFSDRRESSDTRSEERIIYPITHSGGLARAHGSRSTHLVRVRAWAASLSLFSRFSGGSNGRRTKGPKPTTRPLLWSQFTMSRYEGRYGMCCLAGNPVIE